MRNITNIFLTISLFLLFLSCSNNVSLGGPGTGTETTNGLILASNGLPVKDVKILIIDRDKWIKHSIADIENGLFIFDSIQPDSLGYFVLPDTLPKNYNLQINAQDEGLFIIKAEKQGILNRNSYSSFDTLFLQPYGIYRGSIDDNTLNAKKLFLSGSNYRTDIKSNGSFEFNKISEGVFPAFTEKDSLLMISVLQLENDSTVIHPNIPVLSNSVAIEDFESGVFDFTILGRSSGGEWYTFSDNDEELFSSLITTKIKNSSDGNYSLKITANLEKDSLRLYAKDPKSTKSAYAGVGFTIGESYVDEDTVFDLSSLDSITFTAKGHGIFRIKFGSQFTDSIYHGEWNDIGLDIDVDSDEWIDYSITPEMLSLETGKDSNKISWKDVSTSIIRIEFEFSEENNNLNEDLILWLDDIIFEGLNIEQLLGERNIITDTE